MTDDERQFKDFIASIRFDDTADPMHRDRLEDDLLAALAKRSRRESPMKTWRIIMKNRTIRFATSAIVLIAAALTVHHLGGSPDGTSVTFAQVMDQIRELRPYAYTQTIRYHHTDKTVVRRFMILNRHQRREEFPDGTVRIFDYSKEPVGMLQLNPDTKRALWKTYPDKQTMPINIDTLERLRRFEERPDIYKVEDRGVQEMDGHTTKCFQIPDENNVYTVWVDIETKLPVRIELEHRKFGQTLIMTEFDFDPTFDKTQFDRTPPEGYTLSEYVSKKDGASEQTSGFRPRVYTSIRLGTDGSKMVCRMLQPSIDRCRREYDNGQTEIYDYSQQPARCLKLDTKKKQAVLETYPGGNRKKINIELLRIIENAEATPELYKAEDRGIQPMDGHTTKCIHIPGMHNEILFTVWKDVETGLPVRIEQKRGRTLIMTDFEFDVALDPNLFEMKAPEGYTLTEVTYPAKVDQATEAHLIEGLRFLAKFLGGAFPKALEWPKVQQQMRTYTQQNSLEISPVQLKDMRAAIGPFNKYVGRLRSSPKSFDLHYVGDGVHLGEAEKVILWYRPEGTSSYRVVYGDLRLEDVAPEDLPE
jgi:outer membrane lipoprotein-sorting protein